MFTFVGGMKRSRDRLALCGFFKPEMMRALAHELGNDCDSTVWAGRGFTRTSVRMVSLSRRAKSAPCSDRRLSYIVPIQCCSLTTHFLVWTRPIMQSRIQFLKPAFAGMSLLPLWIGAIRWPVAIFRVSAPSSTRRVYSTSCILLLISSLLVLISYCLSIEDSR